MTPELIFVYNADSGKWNQLLDAAHKLLSPTTYACHLCALTHGVLTEDRVWRQFRSISVLPLVFLHRDEFEDRFNRVADYPCVFALKDGSLELFLSRAQIEACSNVSGLIELIESAARVKP